MKGEEINLIDVRGRCPYTDILLLVSGTSDRHVNALAERLAKVASGLGLERLGKEGVNRGTGSCSTWGILSFTYSIVRRACTMTLNRSGPMLRNSFSGALTCRLI